MSHTVVSQYLKVTVGHPIAKSILLYLAERHNPKYGCSPTQSEIADDLELSDASVQRYIIFLESKGFITRKFDSKRGRIMRTYYEFNGIPQIPSNGIPQNPFPQIPPIPQIPLTYPTDTIAYKEYKNRNTVKEKKENNTKKKKKKEIDHSKQITRPDIVDDQEYVAWLASDSKYADLDPKAKYAKMLDWCARNNEPPSRLRLTTWLQKDRDAMPMNGNGRKKGCDVCLTHPHRDKMTMKGGGYIFDPEQNTVSKCKCNGAA